MFNGIFPIRQFHSHPRRAGAPRARVGVQPQRDHPAAPEQLHHGFEEGFLRAPRSPETRRIGRFSTGVEQLPSSGRRGRFSDGGEQLPETPQKTAERRFSEGMEHKAQQVGQVGRPGLPRPLRPPPGGAPQVPQQGAPMRAQAERMRYAEASVKLRELRGSWAYAYANSHGCSWGSDPRLDWVHREEQRLVAIIQEWQAV